MREIKFRAWDKEYKNMFYNEVGFYLSDDHIKVMCLEYEEPFYLDCVVMQYTGLKDKNGKEIYEGDILFVKDEDGCSGQIDTGIGEVIFLEGMWYIDGRVQNSLYDLDKIMQFEIIGNIYENPELLSNGL